jgi:hypothetical protein
MRTPDSFHLLAAAAPGLRRGAAVTGTAALVASALMLAACGDSTGLESNVGGSYSGPTTEEVTSPTFETRRDSMLVTVTISEDVIVNGTWSIPDQGRSGTFFGSHDGSVLVEIQWFQDEPCLVNFTVGSITVEMGGSRLSGPMNWPSCTGEEVADGEFVVDRVE